MAKKSALPATHFLPKGMTLKQYEEACGERHSLTCPKCQKRLAYREKFLELGMKIFQEQTTVLCLNCLSLVEVKTGRIVPSEPMGSSLRGEDVIGMSGADGYGPLEA
ncbi:hypothetical protein A2482_00590 [Candidatus Falkowbacteria bacterium RIFOXYC2_FULL_48_21]|uniref:Uncharacterized protein n=1 Tax=Candidatus Falkowbacteria bacterium RIFOXYC2_FULL_48_21 TaxID=1798005 RepID=A0A1F5T6G2_9BACT|nr:MAG: hypothetical protein A2482_00590 [Candidatus Falkowbacteria bacterium RIFOXYC2_FULL_48_21]